MNLVELLSNELKDKHLTEFEKARYIYLRLCDIFSFDTRWHYYSLFDDYKLQALIKNKKINLENVDSPLVVCHSFSREILKPTLEYFTNLEVELHEAGHSYCMLKDNNGTWRLDATLGDFARVKMGYKTEGFTNYSVDDKKILDETDKELKREYKTRGFYCDRMNNNSFFDIVFSVGKLLSESKCKYHYSDARHFYTSLAAVYSKRDNTYIDNNYAFNRLIEVIDDYSYFRLYKENNEYVLKQIEKDQYNELTKTLKHD